jgi:hypothetical protein
MSQTQSDRQTKHVEIIEALAYVQDAINSLRVFSEAIDEAPSALPEVAPDKKSMPPLGRVLIETPNMLRVMGDEIRSQIEEMRGKLF